MIIKSIDKSVVNGYAKFNGMSLFFERGITTVDDEVGQSLISKYKGILIEAGENEIKPIRIIKKSNKTAEEERLENLLDNKYAECEGLKRQIENLKTDVENWKALYETKDDESKAAKKLIPQQDLSNDTDVDFIQMVGDATFNKLKKICKNMNYPEGEWAHLKTKDDIKNYILQKAK